MGGKVWRTDGENRGEMTGSKDGENGSPRVTVGCIEALKWEYE